VFKISDGEVWRVISVLVGIDLVLLAIMSGVSDVREELVVVDEYRFENNKKSSTFP